MRSIGEDVEKRKQSFSENINRLSHYKKLWIFLKILRTEPAYESVIPLLSIYQRIWKYYLKRYVHPYVHHSAIYNNQDRKTV